MDEARLEIHRCEIQEQGFTILRDVLGPAKVKAIRERVRQIERATLQDLLPGEREDETSFLRTAGLLRIDPLFWEVPIQADVNQVLDAVLGANFLLSTFSGIDLKPDQATIQPLHPDDALIPLGRPHERPIGCTAMFVITPFNAHTGGTRLLPGSHRDSLDLLWSQDEDKLAQVIQPELDPGDVLLFDHALFHGAADNHSDEWRLGLQVSYHAGWIRPYTNWFRSIPAEEAARFPEELTDLLGYKTCNGIGSVNVEPGSYRESYTGRRAKRNPRIPIE
jgi:ectoine hydroxylase-related dioxygenase (phytanoyl-CoA dioxygenase family)